MNTKEKIREAALDLFSVYGYDGVSMAQIGQSVGIKAPSLYKHYPGKQAIFEAILREMQQRYDCRSANKRQQSCTGCGDIRQHLRGAAHFHGSADVPQTLCRRNSLRRRSPHHGP